MGFLEVLDEERKKCEWQAAAADTAHEPDQACGGDRKKWKGMKIIFSPVVVVEVDTVLQTVSPHGSQGRACTLGLYIGKLDVLAALA